MDLQDLAKALPLKVFHQYLAALLVDLKYLKAAPLLKYLKNLLEMLRGRPKHLASVVSRTWIHLR